MERIPLDECKDRTLYRIHSRNMDLGIFNKTTKRFVGIREKFGDYFLFAEDHYDTGAPFGTVHPKKELEPMPEGMNIEERLGAIDEKTGRTVDFDKPISEGGRGWYFVDTDEASEEIRPVSVQNDELFNWIKEKEEKYKL